MPIVYASPEERRRGGWLTRAEGRVKSKGAPQGPRPASLQRILDKAENKSFPSTSPTPSPGDGHLDAPDVRREVGSGKRNDAADVIAVKQVLQEAGLYEMPCPASPSPYFDSRMRVAIRIFQGRLGLKQDGVLRPGDLLRKDLVDEAQEAHAKRCRELAAEIQAQNSSVGRASQSVVDAQERVDVVKRNINRLSGELSRFSFAHTIQEILEATAGKLTGIIAAMVRALNPDADRNKRAIRRIGSALMAEKIELKRREGQLADRNRELNEHLRFLDGLRARQRRQGCHM